MSTHEVAFFKPYSFFEGQKIHIVDGPRRGDWEVIGITRRKIKLRCPVSSREFEWDRFCYHVDDRLIPEWPQKD